MPFLNLTEIEPRAEPILISRPSVELFLFHIEPDSPLLSEDGTSFLFNEDEVPLNRTDEQVVAELQAFVAGVSKDVTARVFVFVRDDRSGDEPVFFYGISGETEEISEIVDKFAEVLGRFRESGVEETKDEKQGDEN